MRYLAFIIAALTSAEMQAFGLAPRLVVNVTIDQLRTDYMEAFYPLYGQGGFRRLMQQGLVYEGDAIHSLPSTVRQPLPRCLPVPHLIFMVSWARNGSTVLRCVLSTAWLTRSTAVHRNAC